MAEGGRILFQLQLERPNADEGKDRAVFIVRLLQSGGPVSGAPDRLDGGMMLSERDDANAVLVCNSIIFDNR